MGGSGDSIIPTILFASVFFGISILLIGNLGGVLTKQQQNIGGVRIANPTEELTADMSLNLYDPVNTSVNATTLGGGTNKIFVLPQFTLAGQTSVGVLIARNWTPTYFRNFNIYWGGSPVIGEAIERSTSDNPGFTPSNFTMVWQSWMGGTLALERRIRYDIITFDELSDAHGLQAGAKNYSIMDSHLRYWVTEFFYWTPSGVGPTKDVNLWNNHFAVSVSTGYNTTGSISAGTLVTKLLTLQLPDSWGIPTFMQLLIAIPIYTSVIIIAVLVVSYFIP